MATERRNEIFDKLHKLPISRSGDRAPRLVVKLRVLIKIPSRSTPLETYSVNISRSGILLRVQKMDARLLEIGQKATLDVDTEREVFSAQILTSAVVARHVESKESSKDEIWVAFKFDEYVSEN